VNNLPLLKSEEEPRVALTRVVSLFLSCLVLFSSLFPWIFLFLLRSLDDQHFDKSIDEICPYYSQRYSRYVDNDRL